MITLRALSAVLILFVAGCQSLSQPPPATDVVPAESVSVSPAYAETFRSIEQALSELSSTGLPTDEQSYARHAGQLASVGNDFFTLIRSGPATEPEFRLWGDYFNRLSDTVEVVVAGDARLADAERLYELAARLYPRFLDRSNLPQRPYRAVDGETSAFYAGNYFLCTMPEIIADGYGRRGSGDMGGHLQRAMDRYLDGPCEPDLRFSAAEMLYDYTLFSGVKRSVYRDRIEQAGPGRSAPWLNLLDNLVSDRAQGPALAQLSQAMTEARANLDRGDEVSAEFIREVDRQRALLKVGQKPLRTLKYQP